MHFRQRNQTFEEMVCIPRSRHMFSRGIWARENPFFYLTNSIMVQIVLAFVASRLIYFLLRPLRQPKFVCNVLAGIILGPSVLGRLNDALLQSFHSPKESFVCKTISKIGSIYYIFIIAVKMDSALIFRTARGAWTVGISCFIVPFTITLSFIFRILPRLEESVQGGIFPLLLAATLSHSFFPTVAHAMDELDLLNSELGQLAMSSAMINEVVGWVLWVLLIFITQRGILYAVEASLSLLVLIFLNIWVIRPVIDKSIKGNPEGKPIPESHIVAVLVWALLMGWTTDLIGASYIPGALIFGLIVPDGQPLGATLVERSETMIMEFFLPLFFVRVGVLTDLTSITDWHVFGLLQMMMVVSCLGKMAGTLLASLFLNVSIPNAFLLGLILNLRGVLELIYFVAWGMAQFLKKEALANMVLSNLMVTAIITPLIQISYKPEVSLSPESSHRRIKSLQSTPRNGELRLLSCIHLEDNVPNILALIEGCNPSAANPICAYIVHLVEFVGQAVPKLAPFNTNRRQSSKSKTSDHILRAFTNYAKSSHGHDLTIQPFTMTAPYKTMHQAICRLAQDRHIPLILVPFHENREVIGKQTGALRQFNTNMQTYAPCTVGILVDRGLRYQLSHSHFSSNVAVLFLGGSDDREALALAIRMSGHPDVSITLFCIEMMEEKQLTNYHEKQLDNMLLTELKVKNINNACVVWHNVVTKDSLQMMEVVRNMKNYDIVMVGRRRGARSRFEDEMTKWVEFPELGVVGDLLVSPDFCGGMMSVLVMQHGGVVEEVINL